MTNAESLNYFIVINMKRSAAEPQANDSTFDLTINNDNKLNYTDLNKNYLIKVIFLTIYFSRKIKFSHFTAE